MSRSFDVIPELNILISYRGHIRDIGFDPAVLDVADWGGLKINEKKT